MTNRFRFALPGLCAILGIVVVAEIVVTATANSKTSALSALHDTNGQAAADAADAIAEEILERPLFTQGRQAPEDKAVPATPPELQGRLAGVMLRSDGREALFTRPGGKPIAIKEGQVIDGWTMSKIESDRVVLNSTFGEKIVKPTNGVADEVGAVPHHPAVKKAAPAQNKTAKSAQPHVANSRSTGPQ